MSAEAADPGVACEAPAPDASEPWSPAASDDRTALLRRLIAVQEQERRDVARELHEETGQLLAAVVLGLKTLERLAYVDAVKQALPVLQGQATEALESLRALSVALRPSLLDDLGLVPTLRSYLKDVGARHGLAASFEAEGPELRLADVAESTVFRIVQEALANVVRHAQASTVSVRLRFDGASMAIVVEDDGRGFDLAAVTDEGAGRLPVGLIGMRERAAFLGGRLAITSGPGRATRVALHVPRTCPECDRSPTRKEPSP